LHKQDGVAPQSAVKGLGDVDFKFSGKRGRAFIPKGEPKGFKASHSIGNYKWIFTTLQKEEKGYVKPRN